MESETKALADFVKRNLIKSTTVEIGEDTPLVSSGLVDSFSLPQLLVQLEAVTGLRIPTGRVSPQDFETVRTMLAAAHRVGVVRTH